MGVDYYNCEKCGEIFNDCGYYIHCEGCGSMFCGTCMDDLQDQYTYNEEDHNLGDCPCCKGDIVADEYVLAYALDKMGVSKDMLIAEIKAQAGSTS